MTTPLKHRDLIAQLTLEEKAGLTSGANFWNTKAVPHLGIESMMLTDGPHGLRKQGGKADHLGLNKSIPATCFPPAATLANSWDPELLAEVGAVLGAEAAAEDVSVLLGPGLNLKRNPLGGRNFEYFSEDPLLSGTLAAAMIRGIQSTGVAACPKHFAVNSQETHRMNVDEIVDTRALHELYLEGFRIAVTEGGARTVMSAYNQVNGTYAHEHEYLLTEVLRRRWGFDGMVVSDWGGTQDRVASLKAGGSLEMPSTNGMTDRDVVDAVREGRLDEAVLDARVDEVLTVLIDSREAMGRGRRVSQADAHSKAVDAATRSVVLLSNDGILPLVDASQRIAIVGEFADVPRYQGAGSSLVNPTRLTTARDELSRSGLRIAGYEPGFDRLGAPSRRALERAVNLARRADVTLLYLGLDEATETEGLDRAHMRLADNQLELLRRLVALDRRIVLVLSGGAPVELPFVDDVAAVVHGYLGGQGGGEAIAAVLIGRANPSGRLAETYPLRYEDVPSSAYYARTEATAEHRESIFVGYRYYDAVDRPVQFPFGHGLSYTSFEFSDLAATPERAEVSVTNTGDRAGTEVVQVYVAGPSRVFRAPKQLAGFATVSLAPGESARVTVPLRENAFASYNVDADRWVDEPGRHEVLVGASSRDIRLSAPVQIDGEDLPSPHRDDLPSYATGHVKDVTADEFAALLGRPLPPSEWDRARPIGRNDLLAQLRGRRGPGRVLVGAIDLAHRLLLRVGRPIQANYTHFILDLPFRSVARMSGGRVDMPMLDAILQMVNGRLLRGLGRLIPAALRHRRSQRTPNQNVTK